MVYWVEHLFKLLGQGISEVMKMTEDKLLEVVKRLPPNKAQEVYDFALFLDVSNRKSSQVSPNTRLESFVSEDEMIDYIKDVGRLIYAD